MLTLESSAVPGLSPPPGYRVAEADGATVRWRRDDPDATLAILVERLPPGTDLLTWVQNAAAREVHGLPDARLIGLEHAGPAVRTVVLHAAAGGPRSLERRWLLAGGAWVVVVSSDGGPATAAPRRDELDAMLEGWDPQAFAAALDDEPGGDPGALMFSRDGWQAILSGAVERPEPAALAACRSGRGFTLRRATWAVDAWVDREHLVLARPVGESAVEARTRAASELVPILAELLAAGPRPEPKRTPVRMTPGALATALAATGGDPVLGSRDPGVVLGRDGDSALGRLVDHWRLEVRRPASAVVEVLDTTTGLWRVHPREDEVELVPVGSLGVWDEVSALVGGLTGGG